MPAIAAFVSHHGLGHAARACAVIQAVADRRPDLRFEIFTGAPGWFFGQSLTVPFEVHDVAVDVGVVQRTPLEEDLDATLAALAAFEEALPRLVDRLACQAAASDPELVLCDVAPVGILVAERLGLPSVLIENFTWDWIYEAYAVTRPQFRRYARNLGRVVERVDLRIQTVPCCRPLTGGPQVAPISRRPRSTPAEVRRRLGVADDRPMVLLSMGGMSWPWRSLDELRGGGEVALVVAGAGDEIAAGGPLIALPAASPYYHPDLVEASDLVVAKLGYSTLAECSTSRTPLAYVARPHSPESAALERFASEVLGARRLTRRQLTECAWLEGLSRRAAVTAGRRSSSGADRAALLCLERVRTSRGTSPADHE